MASTDPQCPSCFAIGDQPHQDGCPRGRGWTGAVTPPDEWPPALEPLEGDFGHHLRENCPDTGICVRHAITG